MRLLCILACCLTACGDDGVRHTPDATTHDGPSIDGAPDGAGNAVSITTTRNGVPVSGVHVYFLNADNSVVLATTTNANGTASAVMAAGGSVTAVDPYALPAFGVPPFDQLYTFTAVKPGDQLKLALANASTAITVTVTGPADVAATTEYAYSPCAPDGVQLVEPLPPAIVAQPSASMPLTNCGATTDFLVVTYDQNNQPLNFAYVPNVAVVDQGTVDLTTATLAGATSKTWTFNNVPALRSLSIEDDLIDPQGKIYATLQETPSDTINPSVTMPVPAFTGAAELLQTSYVQSNEHLLLDWGPYASTFTTDVGARALAELTSAPTYDASTHAASITEASGGAPADFTLLFLDATRTADNHQWFWTVAAPHATSITLPTLPTDVYDFNIGSGDTASVDGWANGAVPGGYDAIRAFLLSASGPTDLTAVSPSGQASFVVHQAPTAAAAAQRGWRGDTIAGHAHALPPRVLSHRMR
jgi:hypothetical protein